MGNFMTCFCRKVEVRDPCLVSAVSQVLSAENKQCVYELRQYFRVPGSVLCSGGMRVNETDENSCQCKKVD